MHSLNFNNEHDKFMLYSNSGNDLILSILNKRTSVGLLFSFKLDQAEQIRDWLNDFIDGKFKPQLIYKVRDIQIVCMEYTGSQLLNIPSLTECLNLKRYPNGKRKEYQWGGLGVLNDEFVVQSDFIEYLKKLLNSKDDSFIADIEKLGFNPNVEKL